MSQPLYRIRGNEIRKENVTCPCESFLGPQFFNKLKPTHELYLKLLRVSGRTKICRIGFQYVCPSWHIHCTHTFNFKLKRRTSKPLSRLCKETNSK